MTPPRERPNRGAGRGSSLSRKNSSHSRKKGIHRGGSPFSDGHARGSHEPVGPRPNGRSDLGGNAFVEGEVADLIRPQLGPVRDVLAVPSLGDAGRGVGVLACLPQTERDAGLVAGVGQAVPDETGLVPELAQHLVPCDVGELLERALLDLIRCDANVLHACSPFARVPLTNQGQRERDPSGYARASGLRWSQRDGTGSVETIPVRPLLPTGTGVASSRSVRLCHLSHDRSHDGTPPYERDSSTKDDRVTRHPKNRCVHPWKPWTSMGVNVQNRQDPTKKGFPGNGTSSPSPRPTV